MDHSNTRRPSVKKIVGTLLIVLLVVIIIASALQTAGRSGKVPVNIEVMPEDSIVKVDGVKVSKTVYLSPGEYSFVAEKAGFEDDKKVVNISSSTKSIQLLPIPVSAEALIWASKNQAQREALGGQAASQRGSQIREKNPLLNYLPRIDVAGSFRIDFGYTGKDNLDTYLIVSSSTPRGRSNAINWIKERGVDPAVLDIRFKDYKNPLLGE